MLVNTSFNMHDEPLVSTADDAVLAFLRADLDALVVDDVLITKADNPQAHSLATALARAGQAGTEKWRRAEVNEAFGRLAVEGPGRFSDHSYVDAANKLDL